jgi:hypothetical protein
MEHPVNDDNLVSMIADYMEQGFLENIIDMFRKDSGLYSFVGELIQDERVRVRVGVTALVEELREKDFMNISRALPSLLPLLDHPTALVRGDAANLVGIIGDLGSVSLLKKLLHDANADVRLIAKEAIEEIENRPPR